MDNAHQEKMKILYEGDWNVTPTSASVSYNSRILKSSEISATLFQNDLANPESEESEENPLLTLGIYESFLSIIANHAAYGAPPSITHFSGTLTALLAFNATYAGNQTIVKPRSNTVFNPYVISSLGNAVLLYHYATELLKSKPPDTDQFSGLFDLFPTMNDYLINGYPDLQSEDDVSTICAYLDNDLYHILMPITFQSLGFLPKAESVNEMLRSFVELFTSKDSHRQMYSTFSQHIHSPPHIKYSNGENVFTIPYKIGNEFQKHILSHQPVTDKHRLSVKWPDEVSQLKQNMNLSNLHIITIPAPGDCYHLVSPLLSLDGISRTPALSQIIFGTPNSQFTTRLRSLSADKINFVIHPEGLESNERDDLIQFIKARASTKQSPLPKVIVITAMSKSQLDIPNDLHPFCYEFNDIAKWVYISSQIRTHALKTEHNAAPKFTLVYGDMSGCGKTTYIRNKCNVNTTAYQMQFIDKSADSFPNFDGEDIHLQISSEFFNNDFSFFDKIFTLTTTNFYFQPDGTAITLTAKKQSVKNVYFEIPYLDAFHPLHFPVAILRENAICIYGSEETPTKQESVYQTKLQTPKKSSKPKTVTTPKEYIKMKHLKILPSHENYEKYAKLFIGKPNTYAQLIERSYNLFFPGQGRPNQEITPRLELYFQQVLELYAGPATVHARLLTLRTALQILSLVPDSPDKFATVLLIREGMMTDNIQQQLRLYIMNVPNKPSHWNKELLSQSSQQNLPQSETDTALDFTDVTPLDNGGTPVQVHASINHVLPIFQEQGFSHGIDFNNLRDNLDYLGDLFSPKKLTSSSNPDARTYNVVHDQVDLRIPGTSDFTTKGMITQKLQPLTKHNGVNEVFGKLEINVPLLERILVICIRMKAKVAVILSGHTGCGKSTLYAMVKTILEFYSNAGNFNLGIPAMNEKINVIDCHGGKKYEDIKKEVDEITAKSPTLSPVILFDELNTSPAQHYIMNYILNYNLRESKSAAFLGALNPYIRLPPSAKVLSKVGIHLELPLVFSNINICNNLPSTLEATVMTDEYAYQVREPPREIQPSIINITSHGDHEIIRKIVKSKLVMFFYTKTTQKQSDTGQMSTAYFFQELHDQKQNRTSHQIICDWIGTMTKLFIESFDALRSFCGVDGIVSFRDIKRTIAFFKMYMIKMRVDHRMTFPDAFKYAVVLSFSLCFCLGRSIQLNIKHDQINMNDILAKSPGFAAKNQDGKFKFLNGDFFAMRAAMFGLLSDKSGIKEWEQMLRRYCWYSCTKYTHSTDPSNSILKMESLLHHLFALESCYLLNNSRKRNPFASTMFIGNPGSSKSMAVQLFSKYHKDNLACFTYLCTVTADADGFDSCFLDAHLHQKRTRDQSGQQKGISSMVFVDELGLATQNPANPLKALHSLFDKGVYHQNRFHRVFCVGASNYTLDFANMNRMILVCTDHVDVADFERALLIDLERYELPKTDFTDSAYLTGIPTTISDAIKQQYPKLRGFLKFIYKAQGISAMRSLFEISKIITSNDFDEARLVSSLQSLLKETNVLKQIQAFFGIVKPNTDPYHLLTTALNSVSPSSILIRTQDYEILLKLNEIFQQIAPQTKFPALMSQPPKYYFADSINQAPADLARILINDILEEINNPKQPIVIVGNHPAIGALLDLLNKSIVEEHVHISMNGFTYRIPKPPVEFFVFFVVNEADIKSASNPLPLALTDRLRHIGFALDQTDVSQLPLTHAEKHRRNEKIEHTQPLSIKSKQTIVTLTSMLEPLDDAKLASTCFDFPMSDLETFYDIDILMTMNKLPQKVIELMGEDDEYPATVEELMIKLTSGGYASTPCEVDIDDATNLITSPIYRYTDFLKAGKVGQATKPILIRADHITPINYYQLLHVLMKYPDATYAIIIRSDTVPLWLRNYARWPVVWHERISNIKIDVAEVTEKLAAKADVSKEIYPLLLDHLKEQVGKFYPGVELDLELTNQETKFLLQRFPKQNKLQSELDAVSKSNDIGGAVLGVFISALDPYLLMAFKVRTNNPGSNFQKIYEHLINHIALSPSNVDLISSTIDNPPLMADLFSTAFQMIKSTGTHIFLGSVTAIVEYLVSTFKAYNQQFSEMSIQAICKKCGITSKNTDFAAIVDVLLENRNIRPHLNYWVGGIKYEDFMKRVSSVKKPKMNKSKGDTCLSLINYSMFSQAGFPTLDTPKLHPSLIIISMLHRITDMNFTSCIQTILKADKSTVLTNEIMKTFLDLAIYLHPHDKIQRQIIESSAKVSDQQHSKLFKQPDGNWAKFDAQFQNLDTMTGTAKLRSVDDSYGAWANGFEPIPSISELDSVIPSNIESTMLPLGQFLSTLSNTTTSYEYEKMKAIFNEHFSQLEIVTYLYLRQHEKFSNISELYYVFSPFENNYCHTLIAHYFANVHHQIDHANPPRTGQDIRDIVKEATKDIEFIYNVVPFQDDPQSANTIRFYSDPIQTIATQSFAVAVLRNDNNCPHFVHFFRSLPFADYVPIMQNLFAAMNNLFEKFHKHLAILDILLRICPFTVFIDLLRSNHLNFKISEADLGVFQQIQKIMVKVLQAKPDAKANDVLNQFVAMTIEIYHGLTFQTIIDPKAKHASLPVKAIAKTKADFAAHVNVYNTIIPLMLKWTNEAVPSFNTTPLHFIRSLNDRTKRFSSLFKAVSSVPRLCRLYIPEDETVFGFNKSPANLKQFTAYTLYRPNFNPLLPAAPSFQQAFQAKVLAAATQSSSPSINVFLGVIAFFSGPEFLTDDSIQSFDHQNHHGSIKTLIANFCPPAFMKQ